MSFLKFIFTGVYSNKRGSFSPCTCAKCSQPCAQWTPPNLRGPLVTKPFPTHPSPETKKPSSLHYIPFFLFPVIHGPLYWELGYSGWCQFPCPVRNQLMKCFHAQWLGKAVSSGRHRTANLSVNESQFEKSLHAGALDPGLSIVFRYYMASSLSQVDLSFGSLGWWCGGCLEIWGLSERDFLHGGILAGLMATVGEGTVCGEQAEVSHFGVTLFWESGASISNLFLTPSVLIRHKCGEFEGILGPPVWRGLTWHPAGIRVTKLCAFSSTGPCQGYIRQRSEICK